MSQQSRTAWMGSSSAGALRDSHSSPHIPQVPGTQQHLPAAPTAGRKERDEASLQLRTLSDPLTCCIKIMAWDLGLEVLEQIVLLYIIIPVPMLNRFEALYK